MSNATLLELDARIDRAEDDGIRARWEFGRDLLTERVGEQLRPGRLDEVANLIGKSRQEIGFRMTFATRYKTDAEVSNAIRNFGSWFAIVNQGLGRRPKERAETPPPPEGEHRCIVADPPWEVRTGPSEWGGSASNQPLEYPTLSWLEIKRLPEAWPQWRADDAHLYLWTINAYVRHAYVIARAWGFRPSTLLVWAKAPHGLGHGGTFSLTTEYILYARRGALVSKRRVDSSWFDWKRAGHSVKPDEFYELVESVTPGPYLDLFGRREREGWTVWGNEVAAA